MNAAPIEQDDRCERREPPRRQHEPRPPAATRALQVRLEPRPDRALEVLGQLGTRERAFVDHRQHPLQPSQVFVALASTRAGVRCQRFVARASAHRSSEERARLRSDGWSWSSFVVRVIRVIRGSWFSIQSVVCSSVATNGSSAARIFRTARKMLCLVAFVLRPSDRLMSSIELPSKWRRTNAARSRWLKRRHRRR